MIDISDGNLLMAPVEALVNTVNTEGVMGKGIALQFKQAYPAMFKAYEHACKAHEVCLGRMHVYDLGGLVGGARWIINFPTKGHWRSRSRLDDIKMGLDDLVNVVDRLQIKSIAIPPLGCGHGGLDWGDVRPMIESAFLSLPNVHVKLFPPSGAPAANAMPNATELPNMTPGRAALILMMNAYLKGLLDPFVSLLEIHKLMYFLQESGEPLRLKYEAKQFGPYAKNLRQVLIKLEGHYLLGYGDGQDNPSKPIELKPGAIESAAELLSDNPLLQERMERVEALIDGFEDSYGLELLSSTHWVMCHCVGARDSADMAIKAVHDWSERKRNVLKSEHLFKAWSRLKSQNWDADALSALR